MRRVLPDFGNATNILIINDEAHHCHRPTGEEEQNEKRKPRFGLAELTESIEHEEF